VCPVDGRVCEELGEQLLDLALVERPERQRLAAVDSADVLRLGLSELRPPGSEHEIRSALAVRVRQRPKELQQSWLGPVEVFEDEQQRALAGEQRQ